MNRTVEPTADAPPVGSTPNGVPAAVEDVLPGEAAVARAARASLEGRARGLSRIWPFLGPAFIAAVAYVEQLMIDFWSDVRTMRNEK